MFDRIGGIDPGKGGAVCALDRKGKIIVIRDAPILTVGKKRELDPAAMADIIEGMRFHHVAIERVNAMPSIAGKRSMGVTSAFNFGMGFGLWVGILAALKVPYTLVTPQAWKKKMLAGMPTGKEASVMRARQLWGTEWFTRKKDEGRAEAALIARWALMGGEFPSREELEVPA